MRQSLLFRFLLITGSFLSFQANSQELVVYSIPAPVGYNWKSPHTLFISYLENYFKPSRYKGNKHPLGHMLIELKDSTHHTMAGAVPRNIRQMRNTILIEKRGLGTLSQATPVYWNPPMPIFPNSLTGIHTAM